MRFMIEKRNLDLKNETIKGLNEKGIIMKDKTLGLKEISYY